MDPALIRHELARILDHNLFARAATLRDIFTFLVDRAILKHPVDEQMIADQVLDIPASEFHPYRNANVRVQVRNLRLKLEAYYLAHPEVGIKFRLVGYEVLFDFSHSIPAPARRALNQAKCLLDSRFPADLRHAAEMVEAILVENPRWASAWETLNYLQISMAIHGGGAPRRCLQLAEESANRALDCAPGSGQAHAAKASVEAFLHWNWAGAERLYERAQILDASVKYNGWYHAHLVATNRASQAVDLIQESLSTLERPSQSLQTNLGTTLYMCRQLDSAELELQRAHKLNPDDWSVLAWLAVVQWNRGTHLKAMYTQTRAVFLARRSPPPEYFEKSNEGLLGSPLAIDLDDEHRGGVSEIGVMVTASILHQWERAIDAMERMLESRYPLALFMPHVPLMDPLWKIQRFRDLVARVGLPGVNTL